MFQRLYGDLRKEVRAVLADKDEVMLEKVLDCVDKVICRYWKPDYMKLRRVEVWKGGQWVECRLADLKEGCKFRMFEPDGSLVAGRSEFTALSDPYIEQGKWMIKVDYEEE